MRIPEGLEPLLDYGVLDDVLRPLMSGKEAQVYLVVSGGKVCVAKVYKAAQNRSFKNRAEYTEGRATRNSRDQRAMGKRSKHGRAQDEAAWRSTEVDMIHRLYAAGVRVPIPHHYVEGVLLMELVCDREGNPAPRLGDLHFTPEQAKLLYDRLIVEVQRMLCAGVVHGDLSDFNVLVSGDGPVIIDFPQSVDTARNPNARKLLVRDVENLHNFLRRWVPNARRLPFAEEMWELHEQNILTPETRLEGRVSSRRSSSAGASADSVLSLIRDANEDERKRRAALGIKGGAALPSELEADEPAPAPAPVSRYAQKMAQRRAEMLAAAQAAPPAPAATAPRAPAGPPGSPRPAAAGFGGRPGPGRSGAPGPAAPGRAQAPGLAQQPRHNQPPHGKSPPYQPGQGGKGGGPNRPPRTERGPQPPGGRQGQEPSRFATPRPPAQGGQAAPRGRDGHDARDGFGGKGPGGFRGPRDRQSVPGGPPAGAAESVRQSPSARPAPAKHGPAGGETPGHSGRGNHSFPHPQSSQRPPGGMAHSPSNSTSSPSDRRPQQRHGEGSGPGAASPASASPGDFASRRRRRQEPIGTYSAGPFPSPTSNGNGTSSNQAPPAATPMERERVVAEQPKPGPRPPHEPRASRPPERPRHSEVEIFVKRERKR
jgi:RIO kinase 1